MQVGWGQCTVSKPVHALPSFQRAHTAWYTLKTAKYAYCMMQSILHTSPHNSHCALTHLASCTFRSCEHHCKSMNSILHCTAEQYSLSELSTAHYTMCKHTHTIYNVHTQLQGSNAIFEISKRRCACLTMSPPLIFPD